MSSFEQNFVNSQFGSDNKGSQDAEEIPRIRAGSIKFGTGVNSSQLRMGNQNRSMVREVQTEVNPMMSSQIMDDQQEVVLEKLTKKNITFINENDFKNKEKCFLCEIQFSSFNRPHHCRLCANTVCGPCSMKRVNEKRVCDICFYKLKNFTGEKRKKEQLKAQKQYVQSVAQMVKKGKKEIESLDSKVAEMEKQANQKTEEQEFEKIKQDTEIKELEELLQALENQVSQLEEQEAKEKIFLKEVKLQYEGLDNQYQVLENKVAQQRQTYEDRKNTFEIVKQQKKDFESSNDIVKLPNYQKAQKFDSLPLLEAIISLDTQYPPEEYYKKKSQQMNQQNNNNNNNYY